MAIKAYVGRMGSGKTYEVVSVVILGALRRGRRVVSNIAGLDYAAMVDLLVAEGVPAADIGQIVHCQHDEILKPEFWRTDKDDAQGVQSFVQPGDLLAIDEIWRFWEGFANRKMPERVMNFFRMHRHMTHEETGVACDVALITQDVLDIARRVRAVIEETYCMTKLTAIGSAKRYRVDVHMGGKIGRKPLRSLQRSYEEKYFPLYKSHSQAKEDSAGPVEENIDDRGNILKGALFKFVLPLGVLVMLGAVYIVWRFFHPVDAPKIASSSSQQTKTQDASSSAKPQNNISEEWRIAGYLESGGSLSMFVVRDNRIRVLHNPPSFKFLPLSAESFLPSGEVVTTWGGTKRPSIIDGQAEAPK